MRYCKSLRYTYVCSVSLVNLDKSRDGGRDNGGCQYFLWVTVIVWLGDVIGLDAPSCLDTTL